MFKRAFGWHVVFGLCLAMLSAASRAETITVTHWGGQFYGVPYAVALDKGFFKEHGVNVTGFLTAPGGGTAVRNTLAGGIPFGEVSLAAAVQAINAGAKITIVAGGTQSVGDQMWVAKKGSSLHSIKDLVGKRVGFTAPNSVSSMVLLMALKASGMTAQQVQMVPAGDLGANLSAVTSGALDAGFIDSLLLAQNEGLVEPVFLVRDVISPAMMQTVCITTTEYGRAHSEVIRGILAARREGLDYTRAHPDEAADITARAYNSPNEALFRVHTHDLLAIDYWSDGKLDYGAMDQMVQGLQITGQLKDAPDWAKMVDTSFLPADQRAAR